MIIEIITYPLYFVVIFIGNKIYCKIYDRCIYNGVKLIKWHMTPYDSRDMWDDLLDWILI